MDPRYASLLNRLAGLPSVAVAYSGGTDSTLLLAAASAALGPERVVALTAVTPYMVRQDISDALDMAARLAVRHELVDIPLAEGLESNPPDRCYRCKRTMMERLLAATAALGFAQLLDGSNQDDAADYRPGLRALRELGIPSPLVEAGIDKPAVRAMAAALGLPVWNKPTNACLLTRIGVNCRVSMDRLQRIEEAERLLLGRGFHWVRVRCHGDLARIEVAPDERAALLADADAVLAGLHGFGFRYVTMDLAGYQLGSMNDPAE